MDLVKRCWTDIAALATRVLDVPRPTRVAIPEPTPPSSPETPAPALPGHARTLYEAIDAFLRSLEGKARSDAYKHAAAQVLSRRLKKARKDCPLSAVDYLWLDQLCDHFKKRPALKKGGRKAPATVTHTLRYLRTFFTWLDDTELGGWQGPRKLLKPFRVTERELMTPAELRQAATIPQFDLDTLRTLYKAASDRVKSWMLTALFTGATQQELAVLQKSEFDLDTATLSHFRNKTQVEGRYWLPPELVILFLAEFKTRPRDRLAFRTQDGTALVTYTGDGGATCRTTRCLRFWSGATSGLGAASAGSNLRSSRPSDFAWVFDSGALVTGRDTFAAGRACSALVSIPSRPQLSVTL